jgi:F-type H+-transporting ATPase subunit delta
MAVEESTIARPYAEAIYRRAQETDSLKDWSEALEFIALVVSEASVKAMIADPKVGAETLEKLLLEICGEHVQAEASNLIRLLISNDRLANTPAIREQYEALKQQAEGTIQVTVASAYVVQAAEKTAIADALKARLGKEVEITTEKDPSLIGGVRIRAGDLVIDGSIQGRLRQLATEFGI